MRNYMVPYTLLFIFLFAAAAHAIDIEAGGVDNTTGQPDGQQVPTVDYVQCPEGYDCIAREEYREFTDVIKKVADSVNEKNDIFSAIVSRLDKKLTQSEEEKKLTLDALDKALTSLEKERREKDDIISEINTLRAENKQLLIQFETIKAINMLVYIIILLLVVMFWEVFHRLREHFFFLWDIFVQKFPIKIPW